MNHPLIISGLYVMLTIIVLSYILAFMTSVSAVFAVAAFWTITGIIAAASVKAIRTN